MRKSVMMLGAVVTVAALSRAGEREAEACGGCFHPPNENASGITDHRMILSMSPQQTTLYDQIHFTGSPSSFAWVLPIKGAVTVGLSADSMFTTLDAVSETTILAPQPVCPAPPPGCAFPQAGGPGPAFSDAGVVVTHQEVVGPYETVQLQSSDPQALNTWLTSHGFNVPADVAPIVSAYVNESFNFLAMKLVPGAGVQSMRPVRVTSAGASPVLPLRMVSAGTGATVGITLWVVADGRYEPQNFPWFRVDDAAIVWDWTNQVSNYRTLRAQQEALMNGREWEVESSLSESESNIRGNLQYNSQGGSEYDADGGTQLLQDDLTALFAGISGPSFRLTRLRADLSHASLAQDLQLQASQDQSELPNLRRPASTTGTEPCPSFGFCANDGGSGGPFVGLDAGSGSTGTGNGSDGGANPDNSGAADSFSCSATTSRSDGDGPFGTLSLAFGVMAAFGLALTRRRKPNA